MCFLAQTGGRDFGEDQRLPLGDFLLQIFSTETLHFKINPTGLQGGRGKERTHFQLASPLGSLRKCLTPSFSYPFLQSCPFVPLSLFLALFLPLSRNPDLTFPASSGPGCSVTEQGRLTAIWGIRKRSANRRNSAPLPLFFLFSFAS